MISKDTLRTEFKAAFGGAGAPALCRAPGRVNLIGEHIDYNGLPVLPMTIRRVIRAAVREGERGTIRLRNSDAQFGAADFANVMPLPPDAAGSWSNYCKAAVAGINRQFAIDQGPGMDLYIAGDIPAAAGLSSSSALVVVTALAYLTVLGRTLDEAVLRMDLAALLAEAERYTGTQGGGMDQAIILLGDADCACKIDFFPLRVERVPIFRHHVFVVCNSLVHADKTGTALHRYNEGPLSCRLLRALVEKHAQLAFDEEIEIERLGDLWFGPLCLTNSEVESLLMDAFPKPRTTLLEAATFLGVSEEEIRRRWIGDLPEPTGGFPLRARALHQLSEYQRVEQGRDCLLADDPAGFGALMDESHRSCAEDYLVSCPEIDKLVSVARDCGALGARLTGAGFGGCTVNLVPREAAKEFCAGVLHGYHQGYLGRDAEGTQAAEWLLIAEPGAGAGYEDAGWV